MKLASFEALVAALEAARVRYLVAGGLAVSAHGCLRYTRDRMRPTLDRASKRDDP